MNAPVFNAVNPLQGVAGSTRPVNPGQAYSVENGSAAKVESTPKAEVEPKMNYLWYILAIVGLLIGLRYAGEKSDERQPALAGVGVYNFAVIGIMAMLFILTGKIIFNKYPVRGFTELFNAV